jgi:hypothetical protein
MGGFATKSKSLAHRLDVYQLEACDSELPWTDRNLLEPIMDAQHFAHFVDSLVSWTADSPQYVQPAVAPEEKPLSGFNNRIALVKRVEGRLAKLLAAQALENTIDDETDFDQIEEIPEKTTPAAELEPEAESELPDDDEDDAA